MSEVISAKTAVRISICGVVEYPCHGTCGEWIREHEAIWIREDGTPGVQGGHSYCPTCAPLASAVPVV